MRKSDGLPIVALAITACMTTLSIGEVREPQRSAPSKRILIKKYGFSMVEPAGWRVGTAVDNDLPLFVNFPWSRLRAQARLPKGGATINVVDRKGVPRRRGDDALEGWARLDAVIASPGTVSISVLTMPQATGISEARLVSFEVATYSPDEQRQREVSVYWRFRQEGFTTHLFCVVGDPRGLEYETVLKDLVSSVRPI